MYSSVENVSVERVELSDNLATLTSRRRQSHRKLAGYQSMIRDYVRRVGADVRGSVVRCCYDEV